MPYSQRETHRPSRSQLNQLVASIPGWGSDLDPKNRPGVPKEKTPPRGTGAHWIEPERQVPRTRIYRSTEHRELTPVFGTSCPPTGLSGVLRGIAYKFSEGRLSHWMILLFADRVNVAEASLVELLHGRPDRPFKEMGLRAEWKRTNTKRIRNEVLLFAGLGATAWLTIRGFRKAA